MTHDELLRRVREEFFFTQGLGALLHSNSCSSYPCHCSAIDKTHQKLRNTMLLIVELHTPEQEIGGGCDENGEELWVCTHCPDGDGFQDYPCPTIQAIEKELA
jgi:hypothetical protein